MAVGVIGQAFPYVPVSHPRRFVPGLTFGIQEERRAARSSTSCGTIEGRTSSCS